MLVNASFVDGGMDLDNDAISCVFGIFRAIKRAEDAVDAQKTLVSIVSCNGALFEVFFVLYKCSRTLYDGWLSFIAEPTYSGRHWHLHS